MAREVDCDLSFINETDIIFPARLHIPYSGVETRMIKECRIFLGLEYIPTGYLLQHFNHLQPYDGRRRFRFCLKRSELTVACAFCCKKIATVNIISLSVAQNRRGAVIKAVEKGFGADKKLLAEELIEGPSQEGESSQALCRQPR